jgi:hypothetical protein
MFSQVLEERAQYTRLVRYLSLSSFGLHTQPGFNRIPTSTIIRLHPQRDRIRVDDETFYEDFHEAARSKTLFKVA